MDDKTKELVRTLNQPHRVQNIFALFKACEQAATLIQDLTAELHEAVKRNAPEAEPQEAEKAKPARRSKKSDD